MDTKTAIILAGGLGTRLKDVVKNIPKPMANINGRPFLTYLIDKLLSFNINHVILSVGYKAEIIQDFLGSDYKGIKIDYAVEKEPLGTGGATRLSLSLAADENVLLLNGDTFFDIDLKILESTHKKNNSDFTIALRKTNDCSRYDVIKIDTNNRVTGFIKRNQVNEGFINGGVFILKKNILNRMPVKFSLETDFIEKNFESKYIFGITFDNYFIDIGIPKDYIKAQKEMGKKS